MRVGCVQNTQRNEIVVVNRKPYFKGELSPKTIKHFGVNMETMVGYNGESFCKPAPETVGERLASFFHKMEVNWNTHVDPKKKVKSF